MSDDFLVLGRSGQKVNLSRSVRILCTARHPQTGQIIEVQNTPKWYTFDAVYTHKIELASQDEPEHGVIHKRVTVPTELIVVAAPNSM